MAKITVASINEEVKALKGEVSEMKSDIAEIKSLLLGKKPSTVSGKGGNKLYSVELKDYEPKKDKDGNYTWKSYNANRTKFCYAVATDGNCNKNPYGTAWEGKVDYSKDGKYYTAKAKFEAQFKYVTLANR